MQLWIKAEEMFCFRSRWRSSAVCVQVWAQTSFTLEHVTNTNDKFGLCSCADVSVPVRRLFMKCFYFGRIKESGRERSETTFETGRMEEPRCWCKAFHVGGSGTDWSWMLTGYELPVSPVMNFVLKNTWGASWTTRLSGPVVLLGTKLVNMEERCF